MALNYDRVKENNDMYYVANRPYHIIPQVGYTDITSQEDTSKFTVIMPDFYLFFLAEERRKKPVVRLILVLSRSIPVL